MRVTAMFHPIDKSKLERWAMSRGYGYKIEMNLLSQGYLVACVEASPGANHAAVVKDMIVNGIRVMKSPGVVMTSEEPARILSGMGKLGEGLWDALPGLERLGFVVGRPGRFGTQVFSVAAWEGEGSSYPFKREGIEALWAAAEGFKGRMMKEDRLKMLKDVYAKMKAVGAAGNESCLSGMGRLEEALQNGGMHLKHRGAKEEVFNPFAHGTRIRGMKKKRAGADMALRKRARKLRDGDYFW
jgi:hypothetical protein